MADPLEAAQQPESATERPDWLEPNFTSVEAQAQSYAAARAEMARAQNEAREWQEYAAQVEAEREEALTAQQTAATPQLPFNPLTSEYQQAVETGDYERQLQIQAFMASQLADSRAQAAVQAAMQNLPNRSGIGSGAEIELHAFTADKLANEAYDRKYGPGAWEEDKLDAANFLAANPDLIPEHITASQASQRLVMAAEYTRGQKYLTASDEERNQMAQSRQQRMLARTQTATGASPPTTPSAAEAWAEIANAPVGSYAELMNRGG